MPDTRRWGRDRAELEKNPGVIPSSLWARWVLQILSFCDYCLWATWSKNLHFNNNRVLAIEWLNYCAARLCMKQQVVASWYRYMFIEIIKLYWQHRFLGFSLAICPYWPSRLLSPLDGIHCLHSCSWFFKHWGQNSYLNRRHLLLTPMKGDAVWTSGLN